MFKPLVYGILLWQPQKMNIATAAAAAKSLQSCLTLCDPVDCSPPRAACKSVRRAYQPQDAGVYLHNFSVPTHFPSDAPEAEGQISEPTGDNPSRCLLFHSDPPLIPTSGASPGPQRSPLPRTTWQWRCHEPRGGCPPCERGRGLSRGTQGLAQSRHQLLA